MYENEIPAYKSDQVIMEERRILSLSSSTEKPRLQPDWLQGIDGKIAESLKGDARFINLIYVTSATFSASVSIKFLSLKLANTIEPPVATIS